MLKRHEIEILLKAGYPKTEVARLAGVSARSVDRIVEESPIVDVNDSAERAQRHRGPSGFVQRFWRLYESSAVGHSVRAEHPAPGEETSLIPPRLPCPLAS